MVEVKGKASKGLLDLGEIDKSARCRRSQAGDGRICRMTQILKFQFHAIFSPTPCSPIWAIYPGSYYNVQPGDHQILELTLGLQSKSSSMETSVEFSKVFLDVI